MRIFEHNFVADKARIRRRAFARQGFLTQSAAKFAEKTCAYACEDGFSLTGGKCRGIIIVLRKSIRGGINMSKTQLRLDFSLDTIEERQAFLDKYLKDNPNH